MSNYNYHAGQYKRLKQRYNDSITEAPSRERAAIIVAALCTLILAGLLFFIGLTSCSSNKDFEKGQRILEQQGYTDVTNTGYSMFCCSDQEEYSTGFECKDRNGNTVKGCFCSAFLKGITVRFE